MIAPRRSSESPNSIGLPVTTTVRFAGIDGLLGGAQNVGARHRLQRLLARLQEILRIAVVFVAQHEVEELALWNRRRRRRCSAPLREPTRSSSSLTSAVRMRSISSCTALTRFHGGDAARAAGDFKQPRDGRRARSSRHLISVGFPILAPRTLGQARPRASQNVRQSFPARRSPYRSTERPAARSAKKVCVSVLLFGQKDPRRRRVLDLGKFGDRFLLHRPIRKHPLQRSPSSPRCRNRRGCPAMRLAGKK